MNGVVAQLAAAAAAVVSLALGLGPAATIPSTAAGLSFGIADDAGKYADDGGASVYREAAGLGFDQVRITVDWDPAQPTTILEQGFVDRTVARATASPGAEPTAAPAAGAASTPAGEATAPPEAASPRLRVVFLVKPEHPRDIGSSPRRAAQFAAYLALLARTYPQVTTFVVGNEPNQPRFWQPQFRGSRAVAGRDYERMLARAYDALKAVNPAIQVVGFGVSSRGNDNPRAASNRSTSPLRFLQGAGAAYRASRRTRPLMDAIAFHPYASSPNAPLTRGYLWPNVGFANLDRLKQELWDAFAGTAQPTVEDGLKIMIDEIGWQVAVPSSLLGSVYTGRENVPVTTERKQARIYAQLVDAVACDPSVGALGFLPFVDETVLSGFQSGMIRADGTERPSARTVERAIAAVRASGCPGVVHRFEHADGIVGATVGFPAQQAYGARHGRVGFTVTADEGASYRAFVVRLTSADGSARTAGSASSGSRPAGSAAARTAGTVWPGWKTRGKLLPRHPLAAGRYVVVVELRALLNAARTTTVVSRPFEIGGLAGAR